MSYEVEVKALQDYSKTLAGKEAHATEISGLVTQSDVGNQSWGVVGCFVKQSYVDMLGELQGLLKNIKDGLHSASDKFNDTAEAYRVNEDNATRVFKELMDKTRTPKSTH